MSTMKQQLASSTYLRLGLALATGLLVSCGGGGGGGSTPPPPQGTDGCTVLTVSDTPAPTLLKTPRLLESPIVSAIVTQASSNYAQQCDPSNPVAPSANKSGSLTIEKQWMAAYLNENYLWYSEIPATVDPNAAAYTGPMTSLNPFGVPLPLSNYFQALKTPALTASGAKRDKFSFTYSTADWTALSQSGQTYGYGIEWATFASIPPRRWVVAMVQPNSPAAAAGIVRGDEITSADGVDFVNGSNTAVLNAALLPATVGESHSFTFKTVSGSTRSSNIASANVTIVPVPIAKSCPAGGQKIGYLLFTDHIATSEQQLINSINQLKAQGVSDLVLDLRYNGGGYLYIASELAYMIAGPVTTGGKIFEKLQYNDKRVADNAAPATPFYNTSCILDANFNCTNQQPLPYLGLSRVYVLAEGGTCSASESVINSLRGVGVDVKIIGSTTCGKPYGFTAKDNCGVSYFPIEFKGTNNVGYGDYSDGFTANCAVADDFSRQLGDPTESMFAGALALRSTGLCPGGSVPLAKGEAAMSNPAPSYALLKPPVRENRILLPYKRP